jgi:hypothetical protein
MGWLWHRRLAHVGMKNLHKLLKGEHVLGLTNVCFKKGRPCAAYQAGKQVGSTHHSKNVMTTSRPLKLLHMDLFGSVAYLSIRGSKYGLVIVDDFSRFTWVHRTVSGVQISSKDQRSDVPEKEGDRTLDIYSDCPLAFQVGLQRLLAALGI